MDHAPENRALPAAPENRSKSVPMTCIAPTQDKNGKPVAPGQSFYAKDDEQADKLTRMGRAQRKEKIGAKKKQRKNNAAER